MDESESSPSFLGRHQFLIRRLHSLSGLIPVGAYMVVHLLTNLSVQNSAATFQKNVYAIHSLGKALPWIEWGFIFLPILFHAVIGVVIIRGGLPNPGQYAYASNVRYTLQRATGMIAFVFIVHHVFHMHGWFHGSWWMENVAVPLGGAQFNPRGAASSAGWALQSTAATVWYLVGMSACVFHLANGIWTMGITWGVLVSPAAQRRANYVCIAFGVALLAAGIGAIDGMRSVAGPEQIDETVETERAMYDARIEQREIEPDPHKPRPDNPAEKKSQRTADADGAPR